MDDIDLRSPAFVNHGRLPRRCAKNEGNVSPPLSWSDIPDEASELALLCESLDAAPGSCPLWLVTGIDPRRTGLDAGTGDPGSYEHRNGHGEDGWGGPIASDDEPRRYAFRLYALPAPVSLGHDVTSDAAREVLGRQSISQGILVGLY
ncbi:YbhB/YbcL family Raf kinase inhibitor-like protein [Streptomyces pimonensis]|uniref:YbhB/YbcL family Raf kinase inhibitor-like protein n=1 Tax=Streptomyces pimonensis TaxID=2860288 RepID=A0ABV4JA13_9ACTN